MLGGAFCAALGELLRGQRRGSGCSRGMAGGLVLALLYAVRAIRFRADQVVVGIAINLLAIGVTRFFLGSPSTARRTRRASPGFGGRAAPVRALVQTRSCGSGCSLSPVLAWLLYRTPFGLRVRAVGEHPAAAASVGVPVARVRYLAVRSRGMLAGLGGAYLALDQHQFTDEMTAGRGFIALAAMIFGRWDPRARRARVPAVRRGGDAADPAAGNAGDPVAVRRDDSVRAHDRRARGRRRTRGAAGGAGQGVPNSVMLKKLRILMITAFVDMVGLLMVHPAHAVLRQSLGAGSLMVSHVWSCRSPWRS